MSSSQRIRAVISGLLMTLMSIILFLLRQDGLIIVAVILAVSLTVYGVRMLIYYIFMARHMVSGRMALYVGLIVTDFGIFLLSISDIPKIYIALYLLAVYAFTGVIDVLRGLEIKKMGSSSWRLNVISGAINIIIAVLCVAMIKSTTMIVYLYSIGLLYSAVTKIIAAFRRTAIVYIA